MKQEKVETLNQEEKEEVDTSNQDGLVESVEKISKNEEIAEDNHLNTSLTLVLRRSPFSTRSRTDDNVYGYEL
ncbi:hypothetical protein LSPH24S_06542 [Lysinibacillus sphaericus]